MKKTLFTGLHILTLNSNFDEIEDGAILIDENKIADIGRTEALKKHRNADIVDCTGKVAMPGLINSHTHLPMSFLKGLGHTEPEVIYSVMFPAEKNLISEDFDIITTAGACEALRYGCTSVVEHYYFADEVACAVKKIGLRGFIGHATMDRLGPHTGEKEYRESRKFIKKWRSDDLITPLLAPHAPDTVSMEKLLELRDLAEKEDLLLHLHIAQTDKEVNYIKQKYNKTPVEFLESINFLSERVLAAHLVHITESDIEILAKRRVNYLCSVVSQLFFEKLAPLAQLWKSGINFCLATDCVASNDTHNLFQEGRIFNLMFIDRMKNPLAIDAKGVLALATLNAAKALKMESSLGSLEIGKLADILILDLNTPTALPAHNIYNSILYAFSERCVDRVIVNGEMIIDKGEFLKIDEKELSRRIIEKSFNILKRIKS